MTQPDPPLGCHDDEQDLADLTRLRQDTRDLRDLHTARSDSRAAVDFSRGADDGYADYKAHKAQAARLQAWLRGASVEVDPQTGDFILTNPHAPNPSQDADLSVERKAST